MATEIAPREGRISPGGAAPLSSLPLIRGSTHPGGRSLRAIFAVGRGRCDIAAREIGAVRRDWIAKWPKNTGKMPRTGLWHVRCLRGARSFESFAKPYLASPNRPERYGT